MYDPILPNLLEGIIFLTIKFNEKYHLERVSYEECRSYSIKKSTAMFTLVTD